MGISAGTASLIAAGVSAATAAGGAVMSSQASARNADAIANQNRATAVAQNQGFTQRMNAAIAQTGAQRATMDQTMADRNAAFTQMREGQTAAMKHQQDILAAENAQEDNLRAAGDTAGQQLLTSTSGDTLADAQAASRAQAAGLLSSATAAPILGPTGTDPNAGGSSGDTETRQAIARRTAEAASNIRTYGGKVANVTSYSAPGQTVSDAIAANRYGIMPAQEAETLLKSGSPTRLAPASIAYQNATNTGSSTDALIQSRGQSGLDAAGLSYGNAIDIANLGQQDASTIAANRAKQQEADNAYNASLGNLVTGVGNLGLYGTGYLGGGPDWLKKLLPGGGVGGSGNPASIAATNIG